MSKMVEIIFRCKVLLKLDEEFDHTSVESLTDELTFQVGFDDALEWEVEPISAVLVED